MVPDNDGSLKRKIASRVRVAEVVGADKVSSFGGAEFIDKAHLSTAIISALQKSAIFTSVSTNEGDIDLFVSVLSQDQKDLSIMHYTARLLVEYRFAARNGDAIWSETYDTTFSSTAFSGATRTVEAREGAVRQNLSALIQGINKRWPVK